jgi:hypothetical protein
MLKGRTKINSPPGMISSTDEKAIQWGELSKIKE